MFPNAIEYAQRVLQAHAGYKGGIDGRAGPVSAAAAARVHGLRHGAARRRDQREHQVIAGAQLVLSAEGFEPGAADGLWGTRTDGAYLQWGAARNGRPFLDRDGESDFGRAAEIESRFGPAGGPQCTAGRIIPPWRMMLAWDKGQVVREFACHIDVAVSGQRAFDQIAAAYDPVAIRALGLHQYGGCYNLRTKRGGTSLSTHAYGVAIDFDPARNRLTWGRDRARLGQPDAAAFWSIWESAGWTNLGRARDYDWMHVQAPAL